MCCCSRQARCESANQTVESGLSCGGEVLPPASQVRPACATSSHSAAVSTLRLDTPAFRAPRGPERGSGQSQCTAANDKALHCTEMAPMKLLNIMARKNKYRQVVYRLVWFISLYQPYSSNRLYIQHELTTLSWGSTRLKRATRWSEWGQYCWVVCSPILVHQT